jgi:membrane protein
VATMIGIITLIVTASGVFVEMQMALNAIWKATPKGTTVSQLIRARAASLGLVAALGFLLMVSLVVSTALTGVRKLPRFHSSIRKDHPDCAERRRLSNAHFVPVRRHL